MKLIIILAFTTFLSACSAMLVPQSDDPDVKLRQASQLLSMGRYLPAERIAKEALVIFSEREDVFGESEVLFFLGNFYKIKANWEKVPTSEFRGMAVEHFNLSREGFLSLGENIQASKPVFETGTVLWRNGDEDAGCKSFKDALSLYKSGKGEHKDFVISNPNYKTAGDLMQGFLNQYCSKSV
ncbi:MAG: hypothetical protein V7785_00105 [Bermanella sp.]